MAVGIEAQDTRGGHATRAHFRSGSEGVGLGGTWGTWRTAGNGGMSGRTFVESPVAFRHGEAVCALFIYAVSPLKRKPFCIPVGDLHSFHV